MTRDMKVLMWSRAFLAGVVLACAVVACTVTPDRVQPGSASYDGGEANSGILRLEGKGAVVTPKFVARYHSLLAEYSKAFLPRPAPNDGVARRPDGTCYITNEVLERLILMSEWHRMGRKPD